MSGTNGNSTGVTGVATAVAAMTEHRRMAMRMASGPVLCYAHRHQWIREHPGDRSVGGFLPESECEACEAEAVAALRAAGCKCEKPLLGYRPGVGPRCRLCNVESNVTGER